MAAWNSDDKDLPQPAGFCCRAVTARRSDGPANCGNNAGGRNILFRDPCVMIAYAIMISQ